MKFSILIANYNNGHFFSDCYCSIINQSYQNWEVIIVDDCSTDNSVAMIQQIIGEDSRFKLFLNEANKGCGYTKNKCASIANGQILGFLDPDDALKTNALFLMVSAHIEMPDISLISSRFVLVDLNMNFKEKSSQGNNIPERKSYLTSKQGLVTHFASFKNESYRKTIG
ncbi:MAG TPA: glycosyltransferase family 2 protein, partial [Flavobacterium sp.]|uniref:glycosyltransferase family 2 protein n=1 Tax=Flavobacterium sp. TaxID=239 RepID=UPI002DB72D97